MRTSSGRVVICGRSPFCLCLHSNLSGRDPNSCYPTRPFRCFLFLSCVLFISYFTLFSISTSYHFSPVSWAFLLHITEYAENLKMVGDIRLYRGVICCAIPRTLTLPYFLAADFHKFPTQCPPPSSQFGA